MNNLEDELLKIASIYGIDKNEILDLTLGEINSIVEAKREKESEDLKIKAAMLYSFGLLMTKMISSTLNGGSIPDLFSSFPYLFPEELKEAEKERQRELEKTEDEKLKEQMIKLMNNFNNKR